MMSTTTPQDNVRRTNIKVCVRIRPLIARELASHPNSKPKRPSSTSRSSALRQRLFRENKTEKARQRTDDDSATTSSTTVATDTATLHNTQSWIVRGNIVSQNSATNPDYTRTSSYTYDQAFDGTSRTSEVYSDCVRPIVMSSLEGYHGSVFAYGQTSTGKTYTMQGTNDAPGVVPLAVHDIFRNIEQNTSRNREFLLRVSYMEIYNEQINDLLHPGSNSVSGGIRIFESKTDGVVIRGLKEEVVVSPEQVFALIAAGEAQRHVGATSLNEHSSRSHTIFRLLIESRDTVGNSGQAAKKKDPVRVSSLSLVDLAGSESAKLTGATGQRKTEGHYINKSLTTLGHVIWKLSEVSRTGTQEHIPYRDSKLTRLLQPSLSGNAQVSVICTISPSFKHIEESHNTLKFASRAKRIKQEASITEVIDEQTLLQQYREEIESLKRRLNEMQEQQETKGTGEEDDVEEALTAAIHNLERLILKTRLPGGAGSATDSGDESPTDNPIIEANANNGTNGAPLSPGVVENGNVESTNSLQENNALVAELHRVKGLLGSALKLRSKGRSSTDVPNQISEESSEYTTPLKTVPVVSQTPAQEEELELLRHQLHDQEVTASLRKADSDFLEKKLAQKEQLLLEISDVLERVEVRQKELEQENEQLKEELRRSTGLLASRDFELRAIREKMKEDGIFESLIDHTK